MEKVQFLETLQTELTDYIDKLKKFDWPTYEDDFIKQSKTVAYMANAMRSIEDNGVTDKQMEYLAKSDTPLGDIAYIWMELEDHFVGPYTAQDAIRDIVDKELLNEEFEDQDLYDVVKAPIETNELVDNSHENNSFGTSKNDASRLPIQVYIENARDSEIGGFTIPLPTTKETLAPWLAAIAEEAGVTPDIAIREVRSSVPGLEEVLHGLAKDGIVFDELNYLAAKIGRMDEWETEMYTAALEAGNHNGSVGELINLAENIKCFDLQPAFDEAQYGEFLIQMGKDNTATVFERLESSEIPEERELAQYILRLEAYADVKAFGRGGAKEENGVFTQYGYIAERGDFSEVYRGQEDIPQEYRLFLSTVQEREKTIAEAQQVIPPGLRSDEMLGKYLYDNKMLSDEDMQAANARLSYTAYPEDYYRLIGKRRREAENGSYGKNGYEENSSVLDQDAKAIENHGGKKGAIKRGKKCKMRRPER